MSFYRTAILILASFFSIFLTTTYASAHAAIVWAYAEGDTIFVEAFFANGTKIQDTKVLVYDENKKMLTEGRTDKEGKFNYKAVTKETQTVVVVAGESHMGDFELTEEDLQELQLPESPK